MSAQRFEIVDLIADNGMDWGVRYDSDLVAQFRNRDAAELFIRAAANEVTGPAHPAEGRNGRWVRLGEVGVDSASIGITDLLAGVKDSICSPGNPDARYAVPGSEWAGDWGTGIRFWAGFGDGGYDVWGWIVDYGEDGEVDERVAQVVVTMIDADELAAWRAQP